MECPHCLEFFTDRITPEEGKSIRKEIQLGQDKDGIWCLSQVLCPSCGRFILTLYLVVRGARSYYPLDGYLVWPRGVARSLLPAEVPKEFADDYNEACLVLSDSPKASAALSRRCLQRLLREAAQVKQSNLYDEISEVIDSGKVPSDLADALHTVRQIGNFAAHPLKSQSTGEIIDVEAGEADWNLDVLESLFEFYFVRPAKLRKRKELLEQKVKDVVKK